MKDNATLLMDLRSLRQEAGISVKKLEELSGIAHATLDRIEKGQAPSLGIALRYAQFLQLNVEEIWGLKE